MPPSTSGSGWSRTDGNRRPAGRVHLVVREGEVVSARLRMSVDHLLARASQDDVEEADVRWPDTSPAPLRISIDPDRLLSDDEVTWTISDFRVLGPVPTPIID